MAMNQLQTSILASEDLRDAKRHLPSFNPGGAPPCSGSRLPNGTAHHDFGLRVGRGASAPPQLGQTHLTASAHCAQKVHS
jgi:hypothetical protein